jgi:hypothetical protein
MVKQESFHTGVVEYSEWLCNNPSKLEYNIGKHRQPHTGLPVQRLLIPYTSTYSIGLVSYSSYCY